jgi:hypothetical protein
VRCSFFYKHFTENNSNALKIPIHLLWPTEVCKKLKRTEAKIAVPRKSPFSYLNFHVQTNRIYQQKENTKVQQKGCKI